MLVKAQQSDKYLEDFGLLNGNKIWFYENGEILASKVSHSPVIRVNALWVDKPIKVKCHVADTEAKKMKGLQAFKTLEENEGMYFPYLPNSSVMFHQGTVKFPLDLIFLKDDCVLRIERNTKVGSNDKWYCTDCCGVIEVFGGFCAENNIELGDRIAMCAVSEQDLKDIEEENARIAMYGDSEFESYDDGYCYPTTLHLVSSIADSI